MTWKFYAGKLPYEYGSPTRLPGMRNTARSHVALLPELWSLTLPLGGGERRTTAYLVGGLLLPPLWTREVFRQAWDPRIKYGLAGVFAVGPAVLDQLLFHVGSAAVIAILALNAVVTVMVVGAAQRRPTAGQLNRDVRAAAGKLLQECHELISDTERLLTFDPLPAARNLEYVRALETQAEATKLLESSSPQAVRRAHALASDSLRQLRDLHAVASRPAIDDAGE